MKRTPPQKTDMLLLNGNLITIDKTFSFQQAMSIRGSRIQMVGTNEELKPLAGPDTRVVDLKGHTVIPGVIDAHAHMDREGLKKIQPALQEVASIQDILAVVKRELKKKKPGEWLVTMPVGNPPYYDEIPERLAEKRYPTRWELDSVSPKNPVYIRGIFGPWNTRPSISVANSRALQLAGIDRETPSPHPSVVIERNHRDEPTGVIVDHNMMPVTEFSLMKVVPRFTHHERVIALQDSMKLYNSVGTTSIYEGHGLTPEVVRVYKALWDKNRMTLRCHLVLSPKWHSLKHAKTEIAHFGYCLSNFGFGDNLLRLCGYFIQLRGHCHVARLRSAELPYTGWAGFALSYNTFPRFLSLLKMAAAEKIRIHTIATGEKELEDVIRAFETVQREFSISDKRWVIEHIRDVRPDQMQRIRDLGVVCQTIPATHIWQRGASYLDNNQKANRIVPHRDFLKSGIPFAMGTDNKPYNPFFTYWSAVVRKERQSGMVIGPKQCLTRGQALYALTMGGGISVGQRNISGIS
ncbi:MAG: amidohydrolase [Deltaproteobacteria bacterium]|nr:amidohydrolase [Deltaproteobacteria bacterium]